MLSLNVELHRVCGHHVRPAALRSQAAAEAVLPSPSVNTAAKASQLVLVLQTSEANFLQMPSLLSNFSQIVACPVITFTTKRTASGSFLKKVVD